MASSVPGIRFLPTGASCPERSPEGQAQGKLRLCVCPKKRASSPRGGTRHTMQGGNEGPRKRRQAPQHMDWACKRPVPVPRRPGGPSAWPRWPVSPASRAALRSSAVCSSLRRGFVVCRAWSPFYATGLSKQQSRPPVRLHLSVWRRPSGSLASLGSRTVPEVQRWGDCRHKKSVA